jgi:hypothetical protein
MVEVDLFIEFVLAAATLLGPRKKADMAEHLGMFGHVGLLVNGPPGTAGAPLV